jgi:hypothetical protein
VFYSVTNFLAVTEVVYLAHLSLTIFKVGKRKDKHQLSTNYLLEGELYYIVPDLYINVQSNNKNIIVIYFLLVYNK